MEIYSSHVHAQEELPELLRRRSPRFSLSIENPLGSLNKKAKSYDRTYGSNDEYTKIKKTQIMNDEKHNFFHETQEEHKMAMPNTDREADGMYRIEEGDQNDSGSHSSATESQSEPTGYSLSDSISSLEDSSSSHQSKPNLQSPGEARKQMSRLLRKKSFWKTRTGKLVGFLIVWEVLWLVLCLVITLVLAFSSAPKVLEQQKIASVFGYFFSVVGLIGSGALIAHITWIHWDSKMIYRLELLRLTAIFDFGSSFVHVFGTLFAEPDNADALCYHTDEYRLPVECQKLCNLQAVAADMFILWSVVMTMLITLHTLLRVWAGWSGKKARQFIDVTKFPLCLLIGVWEFYFYVRNDYENAGGWCWMDSSEGHNWLVFFYGPLWVFILISVALFIFLISRKLIIGNEDDRYPNKKMAHQILKTTFFYQAVEIFHWIFGTANRTSGYVHSQQFFLALAHSMWGPSIGFITAVVYWFCDSPVPSQDKGFVCFENRKLNRNFHAGVDQRRNLLELCSTIEELYVASPHQWQELFDKLRHPMETVLRFGDAAKLQKYMADSIKNVKLTEDLYKGLRELSLRALEKLFPRIPTEDDIMFNWMGVPVLDGSQFKNVRGLVGEGISSMVFSASIEYIDDNKIKNLRDVACKVYKSTDDRGGAASASMAEMGEIAALKKLPNHENVIQLIGVCFDFPVPGDPSNDIVALVFKHQGESLLDYISENRNKISDYEFIKIAHQMAAAVAHLHSNHMIHRDIALRNFLIENRAYRETEKYFPKVVLIDLGLARFLQDDRYQIRKHRHLPWRLEAPEMAKHQSYYSSKTDVWALGQAFKHMCDPKHPPFADIDDLTHLRYWLTTKYNEFDRIPNCPMSTEKEICKFEKVIMSSVRMKPERRESAQAIRDKLKELVRPYEEVVTGNHSASDLGIRFDRFQHGTSKSISVEPSDYVDPSQI